MESFSWYLRVIGFISPNIERDFVIVQYYLLMPFYSFFL